jgi:NADPH:quinone reductase-like Zn-dependent oxidoreductase
VDLPQAVEDQIDADVFFVAKLEQQDLDVLGEMLESGRVRSVIDRRYALSEVGDAMRYLGEGHAKGKLVITVQEEQVP